MSRAKKRQTVGYLRVSKVEQDLEKNKADILALANELDLGKVEFIEEKKPLRFIRAGHGQAVGN